MPDDFPVDVFDDVIAVNVRGVFLCVKEAYSLLKASEKGVVLLVGSGAGVTGASSSIAYGTSKGAVNGMGMTLETICGTRASASTSSVPAASRLN